MKNKSLISILHLSSIILMSLAAITGIVVFITQLINADSTKDLLYIISNIILMLVVLSTLSIGTIYLLKGYSKEAAKYYKAFMFLNVILDILIIVIDLLFYNINVFTIFISLLILFKIGFLLILSFKKDLGKETTWINYYVILLLDISSIVFAIIYMFQSSFDFSLVGYLSLLVMDGTIGLSIKGKYKDKEERGTK